MPTKTEAALFTIWWETMRPWLRRLDYLSPGKAVALGIAAGALAGAAVAMAQPLVAGVGFLVLLGVAGVLAWSGEPVAVLTEASVETRLEDKPPPRGSLVDLVSIPAGTFRMGSPDDEEGRWYWEGPVHEVRVSAFECMRYPVTRRIYAEVVGKDPGWPGRDADEQPVNHITWFDAIHFCNLLSEREKSSPCYRIDGEEVFWDLRAGGYRLPTEAEWEYACRAGTRTRWSFGRDVGDLVRNAWFSEDSERIVHPVGEKEPNPWGLYDMHGNIWEWCWDWYGSYDSEPRVDPTGPSGGSYRVLRGGSYGNSPGYLRSAYRNKYRPVLWNRSFGFRCVRGRLRQP